MYVYPYLPQATPMWAPEGDGYECTYLTAYASDYESDPKVVTITNLRVQPFNIFEDQTEVQKKINGIGTQQR